MTQQSVAELRARAYEQLDLKPERTREVPRITDEVRKILTGIRNANPTAPSDYIYYLRATDAKEARVFLDVYDSIPRIYARTLPIEAFCVAANISPLRIIEILVSTCVRLNTQAAAIIAASNHPRVVDKTVEMALTDDGIEDRNVLHKAVGFLPTPKSAQTTINVQQNATAQASAAPQIAVVAAPPPEQTIRKLADRFNERRALPPTTAVPMPDAELARESVAVDAEYEDEDDR